MLKWIGRILGGVPATVPEGVPTTWATKLEAALAPVGTLNGKRTGAGLARRMASYVLCGEPLSVLQEVNRQQEVGTTLGVTGYSAGNRGSTRNLYDQFDQLPSEVGLRWARLLEACAGNQGNAFRIVLPNNTHWPESLLMHAAGESLTTWSSRRPKVKQLSAEYVERLLAAGDLDPADLLVAAFATPVTGSWGVEHRLLMVSDLTGYPEMLARHLERVRPLLLTPAVAQRLHAMSMLERADDHTLARLAPEIGELAVASSKQVRSAAVPLARRCGEAIHPSLQSFAVQGKPAQRVQALQLLRTLALEQDLEPLLRFARETAEADKAPTVHALVDTWEATAQPDQAAPPYDYQVPTIDWAGALTPELSRRLAQLWRKLNADVTESNKRAATHHRAMQAQGHHYPLHQDQPYSEDALRALCDYIASQEPRPTATYGTRQTNWRFAGPEMQKLAGSPEFSPEALFKIFNFVDLLADSDGTLTYHAAEAFNTMHRASGRPTLLELQQMLEAAGYPAAGLFRTYCRRWNGGIAWEWNPDTVWPFFAHHIDLLIQHLQGSTGTDYFFDRHALFRAVATLPTPPPAVVDTLFQLALGSAKGDRPPAQEALANQPDKEARIIQALADGKGETRAVAAEWLGRLGHVPAVPALEKAVAREKQDVAKGAMLDALERLGRPVEIYLDRDALAVEAKKGLTKGVPKDLEWFPWNALPPVRWAGSGEPLSGEVLRWFLVQAVKQKSPEPNAVLRKYCALFEPRDREAFGQLVLDTWLSEDVRPIAPEEAMKLAADHAQSLHGYMQRYPQHYQNDPNLGRSVEELTAALLPGFLRKPAGSAIGSKGLLAVAAACAGERAAASVGRYLKEYYGTRAAQGKALIAMLAWVDHPTATQLMLAIGNRFRTKSFQQEAARQAEALAERRGWSLAELADRTIPSAGFDETGTLALSYGDRRFTAQLMPDFKVELHNPEGKRIANLPAPRRDDDEDAAKQSKKALSTARKEIKGIVKLQTERLYEALCTERDWSFEDWNLYLYQHPVMCRLVQQLVWVEMDGERTARTFRPLDDGTLVDCDDDEVEIAPVVRVRIAHDSLLSAEEVSRWQQHLVDYEVTPLFQQLGKGTYSLPEEKTDADNIADFEGHLIEAFALRGRTLKLGYTRGQAEDGGWFHVYEKRFPTLGLEAVLEFTGNPLPEENRTVALLNLSFAHSGGDSWQRGRIPLAKVPKVLLSECFNDLRLIAADGSGYDPEWQKKTEY